MTEGLHYGIIAVASPVPCLQKGLAAWVLWWADAGISPSTGKIGSCLRYWTVCPQSYCLLVCAKVARWHAYWGKPEHLASVSCFWKAQEVLLEVAVTACIPSHQQRQWSWLARALFVLSFPAKSYLFPLQELPRPHPSSLGRKISALPPRCFEPALGEWVHHDWWDNSRWCQTCGYSKTTAVGRGLACWECSPDYYSKSSAVSCPAGSFGVCNIVTS